MKSEENQYNLTGKALKEDRRYWKMAIIIFAILIVLIPSLMILGILGII